MNKNFDPFLVAFVFIGFVANVAAVAVFLLILLSLNDATTFGRKFPLGYPAIHLSLIAGAILVAGVYARLRGALRFVPLVLASVLPIIALATYLLSQYVPLFDDVPGCMPVPIHEYGWYMIDHLVRSYSLQLLTFLHPKPLTVCPLLASDLVIRIGAGIEAFSTGLLLWSIIQAPALLKRIMRGPEFAAPETNGAQLRPLAFRNAILVSGLLLLVSSLIIIATANQLPWDELQAAYHNHCSTIFSAACGYNAFYRVWHFVVIPLLGIICAIQAWHLWRS